MATAMRTFGSNLTDLQAGTNADKGLDYQRANAQDAINARRMEAFLRLRGQQLETQARQSEASAARAQRMAEMLQQNAQFGTSEQNAMKRAELEAETRRDVAKTTADGRIDPRMFESFADIQALNNENLSKIRYAEQLSQARRTALAQKNAKMLPEEDTWGWGNKPYAKRVADADALVKQLDAQAATLGLAPSPDGGYVVPSYNPIPVTNFGRPAVTEPLPGPSTIQQPKTPAMLVPAQGGEISIGGVPVNRFFNTPPPVDALVPSTVSPPANRFRWTPNGVVPY